MSRVKVCVIDDSAVVRQVLEGVLARDPALEVIATASDPIFAIEKMNRNWPDVIVLDIEMPRMDGLTFLKKIMAERPTPVVICSSLTEKGAHITLDALAAGAVSLIAKPRIGVKGFLQAAAGELIREVKAAANANLYPVQPSAVAATALRFGTDTLRGSHAAALDRTTEQVVAIGTSTGGTQALEVVLSALPRVCPGIVIVQHMPEKFTAAFADRLNGLCRIEVKEAANGDRLRPGLALIAPGGRHLQIKRSGAQYLVETLEGPPVNRHCPSVDVLFRSVAKAAGKNARGIIMTGMGDDGVRGLKEMHNAGAVTVAQDEATSVVYGMPKEAVKCGAVDKVLPLEAIAAEIVRSL